MARYKINADKQKLLEQYIKNMVTNTFKGLFGGTLTAPTPQNGIVAQRLVNDLLDQILQDKIKKHNDPNATIDIPDSLIKKVQQKFPDLAAKMAKISGKKLKITNSRSTHPSDLAFSDISRSPGPSSNSSESEVSSFAEERHQPISFTGKQQNKGAFSDHEKKFIGAILSEHEKSGNVDELGGRISSSPDKINFTINGIKILPINIKEQLMRTTGLSQTSREFIALWAILAPTEIGGTAKLAGTRGWHAFSRSTSACQL